MKVKTLKIFIFFLIFGITELTFAEKSIKVGLANIPPYSYFDNSDKAQGLEVEIIRECFKAPEYRLTFNIFPYGRLPIAFNNKNIDVSIVAVKTGEMKDVYFSDVVAPEYHPVVISLKKKNFNLTSITDLLGKDIIAHQKASLYYGDEFKTIVNKLGTKYLEEANQKNQVALLYKERADVIVLGINIFNYFKGQVDIDTSEEIVVADIISRKRGYSNVFHSKQERDKFNKCLKRIKSNGTYKKIVKRELSF